jgi:peptide/nickel transport system substrate-binding protein
MNRILNTVRGLGVAFLAAVVLTSFTSAVFADSRPDLIIAVNKLARGLEPAQKTGNVDVRVTYSIFDTLIRRDFTAEEAGGGAKLVPHLATSWKRIDPKTLVVKLRKGVKFHNGDELTSEDVVFTFSPERMTGKNTTIRNGRRYFGHLAKVVAVDKYTVRFVAKKPDLILEQRLASYTSWIVSKRSWVEAAEKAKKKKKKKPAAGAMAAKEKKKKKKKKKASGPKWMKAALKYIRRNPVGTGPLKFVEWKVGDYQKFVAFDGYWGGKPSFKSVTFKLVPEVSTRIAGLVNDEFDIIVNVPPDQLQVLDRYKKKITVRSIVLNNSHVLVYNTLHPVLKDKRVRQALGLAINRPVLISALWQDKAYTPNGHQLKEFGPMYNPARKPPVYDPDKARALLKAAGYKGEPILYRAMADYYVHERAAAQIIQQMWKKVGVKMNLEVVESFKQKRKKDVGVYSWSNTYRLPDPTGAISILWGPRSSLQKKYKFWKAPKEFNDLDKQIWGSGDMKERAAKFQRMLDIFEEEAPMTILYNPFETYAMRKGIEWNPYPLYFMDLRNYNLKISKK